MHDNRGVHSRGFQSPRQAIRLPCSRRGGVESSYPIKHPGNLRTLASSINSIEGDRVQLTGVQSGENDSKSKFWALKFLQELIQNVRIITGLPVI